MINFERGLFIAFEGIDGSGKSTHSRIFAEYLSDIHGRENVILTEEPYKREYVKGLLEKNHSLFNEPFETAKLFIDDRRKHSKELIESKLEDGVYVVSDRYWLSTLAYQYSQGVSLADLIDLHGKIREADGSFKYAPILLPDISIIIDVPEELAMERINKDSSRERREMFERREFLKKVRNNYLNLPEKVGHDGDIIVVSGVGSVDDVSDNVRNSYEDFLERLSS
jgi:dTMP kinase